MRKLVVSEFMSLDGVIQAPGGKDEDTDGGFEHGGWTIPYWHDHIGASFGALMQEVHAFPLGRRTYVTHAEAFEPMHILLYPLTLGRGKRIWADNAYANLTLRSATPYPTGVVGLDYVRAR
jgi:hypothetical protein